MENKTPVKVDPKVIDEKKREREKLLSEKKIVKKHKCGGLKWMYKK